MWHWITEPFASDFTQRAAITCVLLGILAPAVGTWIVLRRLAYLGDAMSHASVGGVAIAFAIGAFRGFKAMHSTFGSQSPFLAAWFSVSLDFQDYMTAITAGSILGLGIPAVMTGPANSKFSEHPARVLFALCISLTILILVQNASGIDPILGMLGVSATGFVWSFYALIRPKIGWAWRVTILLVCLACAWEFFYAVQLIPFATPKFLSSGLLASYPIYVPYSFEAMWLNSIVSILLRAGFSLMVLIAGSLEIAFGKFKDWRTWTATIVIPVCVFLFALPLLYEMVRGYQLEHSVGL